MARRNKKRTKQEYNFPTEAAVAVTGFETTENLAADAERKKEIKKAADALPEIFQPEQVEFIFDIYSALLSFVYSIVLKTDIKPILEELQFEEAEKKAMSKPLARIASKYAPHEWAGMQAEIELITSLGLWTVMSFKRASGVAEREKERIKQEKETRVPAGMRRPEPVPVQVHV